MPSRLTALLGTRVPIIQGGMAWVSRHGLAAAVSEAGALGVIGAGGLDAAELRAEIRALRARTAAPFAVNIPLVNVRPDTDDSVVERHVDVVEAERVPIVIASAGSPNRFTARLKAAGALVVHVVPSVRLARKAADAGVDAVVAEGSDAGGHIQCDGLSTLALVPQVVDALSIPVVAAGGIADARGVAAAFALGADGVQLGTRFLATVECNAHRAYKETLLAADDGGTTVYCRAWHPSRALTTPIVRRLVELERAAASVEELRATRGRHRARDGCLGGDVEEGLLPAGAAAGLVREIVTAADLVGALAQGAVAVLEGLVRRTPDGERVAPTSGPD